MAAAEKGLSLLTAGNILLCMKHLFIPFRGAQECIGNSFVCPHVEIAAFQLSPFVDIAELA